MGFSDTGNKRVHIWDAATSLVELRQAVDLFRLTLSTFHFYTRQRSSQRVKAIIKSTLKIIYKKMNRYKLASCLLLHLEVSICPLSRMNEYLVC